MGGGLESGLGQQRLGALEDNNPPLVLCTGLFRFITGPESKVSILFRSQRQEVFDSGFFPLQPHTQKRFKGDLLFKSHSVFLGNK